MHSYVPNLTYIYFTKSGLSLRVLLELAFPLRVRIPTFLHHPFQ